MALLIEKDIEGFSPAHLREVEELRVQRIARLEADNAALREQVAALQARLAAHDEALAKNRAMGDSAWVATAKKGRSTL